MNILAITAMILGFIGWFFLCISTSTRRWKEDIDSYRGTKVFIGLWQACFESEGKEYVGYPKLAVTCDKDFLRPHLVEPPSWFNSVRALMLLSCIGTGFGIFFFIVAIITDNSKKTGSKYWPCAAIIFFGGLCALVGLSIFTVHSKATIEFEYAGNTFFPQYWTEVAEEVVVVGNKFKIESWLRWSYGIGWGGVAFTFFSLITAVLTDLTTKVY